MGTAQTIVRSFDADDGPGLAVCQTGVTWQNVRVYDSNGRLLRSTPMRDFIPQRGSRSGPCPAPAEDTASRARPFEPQVVFNEFIGCWIITVTGRNDTTPVNASSDALGPWGGAYLSCRGGGSNIGIVGVSSTASTNLSLLLWMVRNSKCVEMGNRDTSIGGATRILTALDPLDGTELWTTQQWAISAERCAWNTRVVEYRIALERHGAVRSDSGQRFARQQSLVVYGFALRPRGLIPRRRSL